MNDDIMDIACDRQSCTRQATHIVTCHTLDHCDASAPSGNKVFLFCAECTRGICHIIADRVESMRVAVAQKNMPLECMTCGLRVNHVSDMLSVEHLTAMEST
jgi:hypothetical protein